MTNIAQAIKEREQCKWSEAIKKANIEYRQQTEKDTYPKKEKYWKKQYTHRCDICNKKPVASVHEICGDCKQSMEEKKDWISQNDREE